MPYWDVPDGIGYHRNGQDLAMLDRYLFPW